METTVTHEQLCYVAVVFKASFILYSFVFLEHYANLSRHVPE